MLGLLASTLFAWPFPNDWRLTVFDGDRVPLALASDTNWGLGCLTPHPGPMPGNGSWSTCHFYSPRLGFTPWPVFGPLPRWLEGPPLGFVTGLAGCALGLLFRGLAERRVSLVYRRIRGAVPALR